MTNFFPSTYVTCYTHIYLAYFYADSVRCFICGINDENSINTYHAHSGFVVHYMYISMYQLDTPIARAHGLARTMAHGHMAPHLLWLVAMHRLFLAGHSLAAAR